MENAFAAHPRTKDSQSFLVPRIPRKTQRQTDNLADYLCQKYSSPDFRPIFLRAAWRLDRMTIDRIVAASFEGKDNPRAYFIASVKKEKGYS